VSVQDFHEANAVRARRFPRGLLSTQTHDTKRSGDARARVGALSELHDEWATHVRRWYELTASLVDDGAPDALERYLIFQTLVAVWPIAPERLDGYLDKALREAKRNTNWVDQNHDWEDRVKRFADALQTHEPFLADFVPFVERVAVAGERSALCQLLLKLTVPGVPDIYQGDELIDLSLVDPDNRRPVDWDARRAALDALRAGLEPERATMKLHVIERALALRARRPAVFAGAYEPVEAGAAVLAFTRGEDAEVLVVVLLREPGLGAAIDVPAACWRDVLTGDEHELDGATTVERIVGPHGLALLERV
jgi:(1->4)-alpha-D-glucan 1-alpha-D-glucosylmutase